MTWHDISTAPKDGTKILGIDAYGDMVVFWWGATNLYGWTWDWCYGPCEGEYNTYQTTCPELWLPLPLPPSPPQ